jgi:hypothetical protein
MRFCKEIHRLKPAKHESRLYFKLWRITGDHIGRMDSLFLNAWIDSVSSWRGTRNAIPDALPFAKSAFIWQLKTIQMKHVLILALATAVVLTACDEKGKVSKPAGSLFRSHFVGINHILKDTNVLQLKKVWALPASEKLRKEALDKIALAPFQLWQKSLPSGAVNQPGLIRPLLDDLVARESYIELNGPEADFDSVLAVQVDAERAKLWSTNLSRLLLAWKLPAPQPLPTNRAGWEVRAKGITFRVDQKNNWLIAAWSLGKLSAVNSFVNALEKSDRPLPAMKQQFLEFHADLPSLGRWVPLVAAVKLPPVDLALFPRGEYIRTEARISLNEPLSWKFEPWRIPTNLIKEPLVGFGVARGIEPLLKALPGFSDLGLKTSPSQACVWSLGNGFLTTYCAFPMNRASNVLHEIAPRSAAFLKHHVERGDVRYATNKSRLFVNGLPLMIPGIEAVSDAGRDYLLAGLLPPLQVTNPPPEGLLAQLKDRNDLLYYHWELTETRLLQARRLYDLLDFHELRTIRPTNSATVEWFVDARHHLGNTITELTASSPKELKVVRKSHIGFTGLELATILRWIESPAFPLGYQPPPPLSIRSNAGRLEGKNNE